MKARFTENYRPLYFLSALGMGGLSISFFMYLMFLLPHPNAPLPTFDDLAATYVSGDALSSTLVTIALIGIAYFAVRHFQLLVANISAQRRFQQSPAFDSFRQTNAEVQMMAIPLTLGMTVNVIFVLAALGVPGMWAYREWLFPIALLALSAVGAYAFALFGRYLTRILTSGSFNISDTNHFSQVLPSFAFAMIGVGFSSAAAMSGIKATSMLGTFGTLLFFSAAAAWIAVTLPVSFGAMLRHGMSQEAGPTLWMGIPIFTLVGIGVLRVTSGAAHNLLHTSVPPIVWLGFVGMLLAAQLVMGLFGYGVMRSQGYFEHFVRGEGRSIASYGLICPGVALVTLAHFFIHWGLVSKGIVDRLSVTHITLLGLVAALQLLTIVTVWRLNVKLLTKSSTGAAAEESAAALV